jgi:hypothetical protein
MRSTYALIELNEFVGIVDVSPIAIGVIQHEPSSSGDVIVI